MKSNFVIFALNDFERIIFELGTSLEQVHCCWEGRIVFERRQEKINIGGSTVNDSMSIFNAILKQALQNILSLDASITNDIGYVDNQYSRYLDTEKIENPLGIIDIINPVTGKWVEDTYQGDKYRLWDYHFTAWMYNDINGEIIIFEITPRWPGFFGKPSERKKAIPYTQWMAQYKPYLITTIPREVAQQWLEQTEFILKTIEENIKRFEAEVKATEATTKDL